MIDVSTILDSRDFTLYNDRKLLAKKYNIDMLDDANKIYKKLYSKNRDKGVPLISSNFDLLYLQSSSINQDTMYLRSKLNLSIFKFDINNLHLNILINKENLIRLMHIADNKIFLKITLKHQNLIDRIGKQ